MIFHSYVKVYQRVTCFNHLVGGAITILKNYGVRQWEGWHPFILWKIKHVPNHQPEHVLIISSLGYPVFKPTQTTGFWRLSQQTRVAKVMSSLWNLVFLGILMGLNQTKWDLIKRDKMLVETLNQTHGFFGEANHWILAAIVEINQANWDWINTCGPFLLQNMWMFTKTKLHIVQEIGHKHGDSQQQSGNYNRLTCQSGNSGNSPTMRICLTHLKREGFPVPFFFSRWLIPL